MIWIEFNKWGACSGVFVGERERTQTFPELPFPFSPYTVQNWRQTKSFWEKAGFDRRYLPYYNIAHKAAIS